MSEKYDAIVIGAGLSGLAATLRFAMYDKKVCLLEQHSIPGGLNSYYRRGQRKLDVGLHAMTNFSPPKARTTPMGKLFKQLRLPRAMLNIVEQSQSCTRFGNDEIRFSNEADMMYDSVAQLFPQQTEGFSKLWKAVDEVDYSDLSAPWASARKFVQAFITDSQLEDMIFCPLLFYGSAWEHDMDLQQFAILFRSIYMEGFCRPKEGIRPLLKWLTDQLKEKGAELKFRTAVESIVTDGSKVQGVQTSKGEFLESDLILSSMGRPETEMVLGREKPEARPGALGYLETIMHFPSQSSEWGIDDTIVFWNCDQKFNYEKPKGLIDDRSAVVCFPGNFQGMEPDEGICRITRLASYDEWKALSRDQVLDQKAKLVDPAAMQLLKGLAPTPPAEPSFIDTFTPLTVEKFTRHAAGAVYGSPDKIRDGKTDVDGLHLIGTDQGYLGIVGAMLSGISMANQHLI